MIVVVGLGLFVRSHFAVSLPHFVRKYGGDALWAWMVFLGFGLLFRKHSTLRTAVIAVCFAWAIEFSQLYHAPWIDHIRDTRLGALVLGSVFNWPDLLAYVVGIAAGVAGELAMRPRR